MLFACVLRGASPSQVMNRQSPCRYAINLRLGNRSENRSTRLTPTKTRVAFVAASSCSTTVCLGSESGVEGQLESPGGADVAFRQAIWRNRWPSNLHCPFCQIARPQPCCYGGPGLGRCAKGSGCFGVPWCSAVRRWQAGPGGGGGRAPGRGGGLTGIGGSVKNKSGGFWIFLVDPWCSGAVPGLGPRSAVPGLFHVVVRPQAKVRAGDLTSIPWGARWTPPRSQLPPNVIKRAHPTRLGNPLGH
jgi:hypothetical protein